MPSRPFASRIYFEALAIWEDFDATYRVSHLGTLVFLALDARFEPHWAPHLPRQRPIPVPPLQALRP